MNKYVNLDLLGMYLDNKAFVINLSHISSSVKKALDCLNSNGYEVYIVGGSIRDLVMGLTPHDWDLTTSAPFENIIKAFKDQGSYTKGFRHDTVNVHFNDMDIEVTSYRGEDKTSLESDLKKRDFTIDSLAYSSKTGLVDTLGSLKDIQDKVIRCSYNALDDFADDPLRILRGIRLAGEFGFRIEGKTKDAMSICADLIKDVALERFGEEFRKIIVLKDSDEIIRDNFNVFSSFIPELKPMKGFDQHSPYHEYDVLEHSLQVLKAVKKRKPSLCLAALFHDIGKPKSFFMKDGLGHFYGHGDLSSQMAYKIMTRLKYSNDLINEVCLLVKWHMVQIEKKKTVKKLMNKMGKDVFYELLELREADIRGCSHTNTGSIPYLAKVRQMADQVIENKECFSLKDLAINGYDLEALGIKEGKEIGIILHKLFEEVLDEKTGNKKTNL